MFRKPDCSCPFLLRPCMHCTTGLGAPRRTGVCQVPRRCKQRGQGRSLRSRPLGMTATHRGPTNLYLCKRHPRVVPFVCFISNTSSTASRSYTTCFPSFSLSHYATNYLEAKSLQVFNIRGRRPHYLHLCFLTATVQ
jgi:hypothetical protein